MPSIEDLAYPEPATATRQSRQPVLSTVLAAGAILTALLTGLGFEWDNKSLQVLPLTVFILFILAGIAVTKFLWFVLGLLALRSSLDALHLSIAGNGTTVGNTAANHGLDPSSLVGVLFLAASVLWIASRYYWRSHVESSRVTVWLVAFVAACLISLSSSSHLQAGMLQAFRVTAAVAMFVVLEQLIVDNKTRFQVIAACYASMLIPLGYVVLTKLITILQRLLFASGHTLNLGVEVKSGLTRLVSTFSQSNDFARYLSVMVIFGIAIYHFVRGGKKIALTIALALGGIMLCLTLTLGAMAVTVLGITIIAVLQRRRRLFIGMIVACVVAFVLVGGIGARIVTSDTSSQVGGKATGNSVAWRFGYWADVLPLANRNPLTGIGLDSTQYETSSAKQPHNDYLLAYVETGLVGLVTYVGFLGAMAAATRRAVKATLRGTFDHAIAVGAFACVVSFIVESAAANVITNVVNLWYILAFAAVATTLLRDRETQADQNDDDAVSELTVDSAP